jgi:GTP-binding protein
VHKLFYREVKFIKGATKFNQAPEYDLPECAFWGRSNVGKSSLINALLNQKVAKTSNTPGRTREINFFTVDDTISIVDLPGYGYAYVPEGIKQKWLASTIVFIQRRVNLKRIYVLIDARRNIMKADIPILDALDSIGMSYQIIVTKSDKANTVIETNRPACYPEVIHTSSKSKVGIDSLQQAIFDILCTAE